MVQSLYPRQDFASFPVKSLYYTAPGKADASCPYVQFSFFIGPGQTESPCVSFSTSAMTGYSVVTMLTEVPEDLLEWANKDGNVEEE